MAIRKQRREACAGAVAAAAGLLLAVVVSLPGLLHATGAVSPPAAAASQAVRGEVMIITDSFYVVKDAVGKGMVQVLVNKATELDGLIKQGDQIVAQLSTEGYALSIKKTDER